MTQRDSNIASIVPLLAEIAGRDSVAAVAALAREREIPALLPTIVATGTEYGDADAPLAAIARIREVLGEGTDVLEPVRIAIPKLWAALNGRFQAELRERYATWSPCSACHLYVHLARVPLAWRLGATEIVTGERDAHRGRIKLSQTPETIDAAVAVLHYAGISLLEPIRAIDADDRIAELAGGDWGQGSRQLECVLSGNYTGIDGAVRYDAEEQARYLCEFFVPAGRAVIDAWRAGESEPDYTAIVRGILAASRA